MCLCDTIRQLADSYDEADAQQLSPGLSKHLASIRVILGKSKALSRDVRFQVVPNNQRTMKILSIKHADTTRVDGVYDRFKNVTSEFWSPSDDLVHSELRRRLTCVAIYLRSKMDVASTDLIPATLPSAQGLRISELRYAGRKYIKIARRLGGIGSIIWLPLDIPASTYERYLNMDDEEIFDHLQSLQKYTNTIGYSEFVRGVLRHQLNTPLFPQMHYNLVHEYKDILQNSDQLLLLVHALGGSDVPLKIFENVRLPKRRWSAGGELEGVMAEEFGLPSDLGSLIDDELYVSPTTCHQEIECGELEDGAPTWSIRPDMQASLSCALTPQTKEHLSLLAMRLICFVTPPPLEGNTSWSVPMKKAIWRLLERVMEQKRATTLLNTHVMESLFYFAERDSFPIRRLASSRARTLLNKAMPYYFHACVTLFEGIMNRLDGNLVKSISQTEHFLKISEAPTTRLDKALQGRLHISLIETKIQQYDPDIASCIYGWEGTHPLSTLEIEVTRRLQGTAARFFQSIGDFHTAQASLEQHLWLNSTKPIRYNTRLLIVGRLAEIYCELHEYQKAIDLLRPEFDGIPQAEQSGRPYRRLLLALVEAETGLGKPAAVESTLQILADIEPPALDDMNDQVLHMRRIIATARIFHQTLRFGEALERWKSALQSTEQLHIFTSKHPWTQALIYLSMAHAQLKIGDQEGSKRSWAIAVDISRLERCEYTVPVVANTWMRNIVDEIHQSQGWPFRMMLPGGKPDISWP